MKRIISCIMAIVLVLISMSASVAAAAKAKKFSDIPSGAWYETYVNKATEKGIIGGYPSGKFGPADSSLVAQVIKMVLNSMGYKGLKYYSGYVEKARELGLIKAGEFIKGKADYERPMTRAEIARIVVRALASKNEKYPENEKLEAYKTLIKDFDKVKEGYREYVLKAYFLGVIEGGPGGFNPEGSTSRASASKILLAMVDPTSRATVSLTVDEHTKIINGYTIPVNEQGNPAAIVDKEALFGAELRYNVNLYRENLAKQFEVIRDILASKFGMDKAIEVVDYARQKTDVKQELKGKTFSTDQNRTIAVYSNPRSSQISISVFY